MIICCTFRPCQMKFLYNVRPSMAHSLSIFLNNEFTMLCLFRNNIFQCSLSNHFRDIRCKKTDLSLRYASSQIFSPPFGMPFLNLLFLPFLPLYVYFLEPISVWFQPQHCLGKFGNRLSYEITLMPPFFEQIFFHSPMVLPSREIHSWWL